MTGSNVSIVEAPARVEQEVLRAWDLRRENGEDVVDAVVRGEY